MARLMINVVIDEVADSLGYSKYSYFYNNVITHRRYKKNLTAPQKTELYYLLREDKELQDYMISNKILFEELTRRDKAFEEVRIQLTTRQEL